MARLNFLERHRDSLANNAKLFGDGGCVNQYKGEHDELLDADEHEYEIPQLECQKDARVGDNLCGCVRVRANSFRVYVSAFWVRELVELLLEELNRLNPRREMAVLVDDFPTIQLKDRKVTTINDSRQIALHKLGLEIQLKYDRRLMSE